MALLLRKLGRRSDWIVDAPNWLPDRDAPGSPLRDFIPDEQGKLSVWTVEGDESNLPRIVAAIAATRDAVSVVDFVLFDARAVRAAGVALVPGPGESPDRAAKQKWHRDLAELSAKRVARLVWRVFYRGTRARVSPKEVAELLRTAVGKGWLRFDDLKPNVKEKLQRAAGGVVGNGVGDH